jgi:hypothetical protein
MDFSAGFHIDFPARVHRRCRGLVCGLRRKSAPKRMDKGLHSVTIHDRIRLSDARRPISACPASPRSVTQTSQSRQFLTHYTSPRTQVVYRNAIYHRTTNQRIRRIPTRDSAEMGARDRPSGLPRGLRGRGLKLVHFPNGESSAGA